MGGRERSRNGGLNFFFSSRRRHTRFDCDWSSDVCSSDLSAQPGASGTTRLTHQLECIDENINFLAERRSEEHTSELQSQSNLVCRLLLEKKNKPRPPKNRQRSPAAVMALDPRPPRRHSVA